MAENGYAGEILKIDLSTQNVSKLATAEYAERFIGGKGIAAKLYWDNVPPQTRAFDPENCLICISGPATGFTGFASSRWLVCGKTAAGRPEAFSYGNLGGSWGNRLKHTGYDGIVVQGKADKPVYLFVHDGIVETRDASHLWGKSAFEASDSLKAELGKSVNVLTIGQAAENLVVFATLLADEGASGSGGVGSIMGSKMLKAIVVAGEKRHFPAADPERLKKAATRVRALAPAAPPAPVWWIIPGVTRTFICNGCGIGCDGQLRQSYIHEDGKRYKSFCQAIDAYRRPVEKYYNLSDGEFHEALLLAMRLFDRYGLDTSVMQPLIEWLTVCYGEGVLNDSNTGLPMSKIGSVEFIEALTRKIALREGFGDILAQGTLKAAESVGGKARELVNVMNRSSENNDYDPRLILHNALLIATEPRKAVQQNHEATGVLMGWSDWLDKHETDFILPPITPQVIRDVAERYWGSAAAADYSSYEGKALASKMIQDRTYAMESLILCNDRWPWTFSHVTRGTADGPEIASQIYSAITGRELDEAGLMKAGERIFNLNRAVLIRQGWGGREGDKLLDKFHEVPLPYLRWNRECRIPGRNGETTSRKGAVVERKEFEKMKSEYYQLRGWDVESGLQTRARLQELNLGDIADDLDKRGRLK